MNTAVKVTLGAVVLGALAIGGEVAYLYHRHHAEDKAPATAAYKTDPDDLVFLKQQHAQSLADEKDLKGHSVWVSAGGQLDYFPVKAGRIDFSRSEGVLLSTEQLDVKDAVEQVVPKAGIKRIPAGDKQVLLLFTKPKDPAHPGEYAVAIGDVEKGTYNLLADQVLFYDDPHQLFNYWGPKVWAAIDRHEAIPGMTERQAQTALGQISDPHGDTIGDRTVVYHNEGHPIRVVFVDGKATSVKSDS